jgi:hypothetical protein
MERTRKNFCTFLPPLLPPTSSHKKSGTKTEGTKYVGTYVVAVRKSFCNPFVKIIGVSCFLVTTSAYVSFKITQFSSVKLSVQSHDFLPSRLSTKNFKLYTDGSSKCLHM